MQQDMEIPFVTVHPTQDGDISSSLVPRASGSEPNHFVDWCNKDSMNNSMLWMASFDSDVKQAVGKKSYRILHHLLDVYLRNISNDLATSKIYSAAKLRDHTRKILMFFHLFYRDIKDMVADHNFYLDKMSEIIQIFVETELRASRISDAESTMQISANLLAALHIYLDNSEEHVLRVLLGTKLFNGKYSKIYRSIFRKCCANMNERADSITDVTYVRYLLVLKLWKKTCEDTEEKRQIDELALKILGPRVPNRGIDATKFLSFLRQKSGTVRLMKQNSFDLRRACEDFVDFERRINGAGLTEEDTIMEYNL